MATPLRVLIACEFSGVVRRAFRDRGHEAWSCDVLPAEDASPYHFQNDVRDVLWGAPDGAVWDLLIAHPPCTFLANSANKHLWIGGKKSNGPDLQRWSNMRDAAEFFLVLLNAPIGMVAVENPIMGKHAKALIGVQQTQIIQPWQFGQGEIKATCLWLKNLPRLVPSNVVGGRTARVHREPPSPERWKNRSRTLPGIAAAMADQWGGEFVLSREIA